MDAHKVLMLEKTETLMIRDYEPGRLAMTYLDELISAEQVAHFENMSKVHPAFKSGRGVND